MNDEDFRQTVLDYFDIEQQRHREQMAQASDILAKITAVVASIDAMKTKFDTAMTDMVATVPAGHAAVLDTLVAPLDDLATKIMTLGSEFEAKIKALPVPGTTPTA
jgi:hypothetical protein